MLAFVLQQPQPNGAVPLSYEEAIVIYDRNQDAIAAYFYEEEPAGSFESVVGQWMANQPTATALPLFERLRRKREAANRGEADANEDEPSNWSPRKLKDERKRRVDDLLDRRAEIKKEKVKSRGSLARGLALLVLALAVLGVVCLVLFGRVF